MLAIVFAIGWPIWPLIIASVVALALIIERSIALRRARILPTGLLPDVLALVNRQQLTPDVVDKLEANSALGRVLSATLRGAPTRRDLAIQQAETAGSLVANQLSRYLTLLGSIGSIAPLLGLLGTVVGMIEIFASQQGGSDPAQLAHGISIALYCTAFGIIVAVPSVLS
ncbi:MAG: MotA/TolQ/ExbB proton channel family protein, partial [Burkholderiaceae bacterium]